MYIETDMTGEMVASASIMTQVRELGYRPEMRRVKLHPAGINQAFDDGTGAGKCRPVNVSKQAEIGAIPGLGAPQCQRLQVQPAAAGGNVRHLVQARWQSRQQQTAKDE